MYFLLVLIKFDAEKIWKNRQLNKVELSSFLKVFSRLMVTLYTNTTKNIPCPEKPSEDLIHYHLHFPKLRKPIAIQFQFELQNIDRLTSDDLLSNDWLDKQFRRAGETFMVQKIPPNNQFESATAGWELWTLTSTLHGLSPFSSHNRFFSPTNLVSHCAQLKLVRKMVAFLSTVIQ